MKRKVLCAILSPICLLACALGLVACDDGNPPAHTHSWSTVWEKDDAHHWHACLDLDCPIKNGYAEHDFSDGDCVCGKVNLAANLKFELEPDNASYAITGILDNTITELTLPDIYNRKPVSRINYMAFSDCRRLTSVTIPDSITSIEEYAFAGCSSLTQVTFGNQLKSIGDYVFDGCRKLTAITIPDSLKSIGEGAFNGCAIETAAIPAIACSSVNTFTLKTVVITSGDRIDDEAFLNCSSLETVTIPNGVTSIGESAFGNCVSLTDITIPDEVTDIGKDAFYNCSVKTATIPASAIESIPKTILNTVVITSGNSIDEYAFNYCINLTSVTIPESVNTIGENAFNYCNKLKTVSYKGEITGWCDISGLSNLTKNVSDLTLLINGRELTVLTVPNTVTFIPAYAFYNCTGLTGVTLPDSIRSIGEYAFNGCPIEIATIPATACRAVNNPALKTVTITSGSNIGDNAFLNCNRLSSITIPESVTNIATYAFKGCTGLKTIYYNGDGVTDWLAISGITNVTKFSSSGVSLYINGRELTELTIPDEITSIPAFTFYNFGNLTSVTIPNTVTGIGESAFSGCRNLKTVSYNGNITGWCSINGLNNLMGSIADATLFINGSKLTELTVPDGLTDIPAYAFRNCGNLTSLTIPDSLKNIGNYAFSGCNNLKTVSYNGNITGWCAINGLDNLMGVVSDATLFINGNKLTELTIPDDITAVPAYAFRNCGSLTSLIINETTTSIANDAFAGCPVEYAAVPASSVRYIPKTNLKTVVITSGDKIGDEAFNGCNNLTNITIPVSVTYISENAFTDCPVENATVPAIALNSIKSSTLKTVIITNGNSIDKEAFLDCTNLISVTLPDSITSIGEAAFKNCTSLTDIIIPDGVTGIGKNAFYNCSSLETVTIPDSITIISYEAFYNCSSLKTITIPDGVTSIDALAFHNCGSLTSVTIPDSVTSINYAVFNGCSSLTTVTLPANLTDIKYKTFYNCTNLTDIIIPDSVTSIGFGAFYNCSSLKTVTVPQGVKKINLNTFYNCTSLTGLNLPDGLTGIDEYAFGRCESLTNITLPESVTHIGKGAFSGCISLTNVIIPNGVAIIGSYAFHFCSSLTSITLPDGVTSIGDHAFYYCSNLTTVTIPDGVTSIGESAFGNCVSLTDINYNGTIQQWNSINKNSNWFIGPKNFTIHCTDGDITDVNS